MYAETPTAQTHKQTRGPHTSDVCAAYVSVGIFIEFTHGSPSSCHYKKKCATTPSQLVGRFKILYLFFQWISIAIGDTALFALTISRVDLDNGMRCIQRKTPPNNRVRKWDVLASNFDFKHDPSANRCVQLKINFALSVASVIVFPLCLHDSAKYRGRTMDLPGKKFRLFLVLLFMSLIEKLCDAFRPDCPGNSMAQYKMELRGTWMENFGAQNFLTQRGFPDHWRWGTGLGK